MPIIRVVINIQLKLPQDQSRRNVMDDLMSVYPPTHPHLCLSIYLSVCPSVYLSI